jgi:HPt (histidine-containing phosphotransfer) domain-containing protein
LARKQVRFNVAIVPHFRFFLCTQGDTDFIKMMRSESYKKREKGYHATFRTGKSDFMNPIDTETLSGLKEMLGDDLYEITGLYASTLSGEIQSVQDCYASGDMARLNRLAHALKGSSANMGATELARLAAAVEKLALAGDRSAVEAVLKDMPQVAQATLAAFKSGGFLGPD